MKKKERSEGEGRGMALQFAVDALFFDECTIVRLGSLSIIKNCQMHFGRAARRITAGAEAQLGSSPGVTAGYSPEGGGG